MESKTFDCYGNELTGALSALMNFERDRKREIEGIISEHDALEDRAERLATKLTEAKVELNKRLSTFHAELQEAESKVRADMLATMGTPGKKTTHLGGDNFELEIVGKLEKRARGILGLRGRALDCLKLERDHAALRMEVSMIAEKPFRARQEAARNFFNSLLQVAQIGMKFTYADSNFDQASAWSKKVKELDGRLAIAADGADHFPTIGLTFTSVDGCLEFALQIPEKYFDQLLEAWGKMRIAGVKRGGISLDQQGVVSWRGARPEPAPETHTRQTHDKLSGAVPPQRSRARV
jgi:hypothetical protein